MAQLPNIGRLFFAVRRDKKVVEEPSCVLPAGIDTAEDRIFVEIDWPSEDGFNHQGSGPAPIGPRASHDFLIGTATA